MDFTPQYYSADIHRAAFAMPAFFYRALAEG
jgi:spermidine synthase